MKSSGFVYTDIMTWLYPEFQHDYANRITVGLYLNVSPPTAHKKCLPKNSTVEVELSLIHVKTANN